MFILSNSAYKCSLCEDLQTSRFFTDEWREYFRCSHCSLIFVPAEYHLSTKDEKAEYDLHQNSPDDSGYRHFLGRLFDPVRCRLTRPSTGLDFGSGPGPTLSIMFDEAGHRMANYDPYYAGDASLLTRQYDFVTCSEVVEHFRQPRTDLNRLWSCVKPGGLLGIMTKLAKDRDAFSKWHYKNDRTHLNFFSRDTFQWLAAKWKADLIFIGKDIALFTRGSK